MGGIPPKKRQPSSKQGKRRSQDLRKLAARVNKNLDSSGQSVKVRLGKKGKVPYKASN